VIAPRASKVSPQRRVVHDLLLLRGVWARVGGVRVLRARASAGGRGQQHGTTALDIGVTLHGGTRLGLQSDTCQTEVPAHSNHPTLRLT
jgi:hypothetical protein